MILIRSFDFYTYDSYYQSTKRKRLLESQWNCFSWIKLPWVGLRLSCNIRKHKSTFLRHFPRRGLHHVLHTFRENCNVTHTLFFDENPYLPEFSTAENCCLNGTKQNNLRSKGVTCKKDADKFATFRAVTETKDASSILKETATDRKTNRTLTIDWQCWVSRAVPCTSWNKHSWLMRKLSRLDDLLLRSVLGYGSWLKLYISRQILRNNKHTTAF